MYTCLVCSIVIHAFVYTTLRLYVHVYDVTYFAHVRGWVASHSLEPNICYLRNITFLLG